MSRRTTWPTTGELGGLDVDELVQLYADAASASDELSPTSQQNRAADCVANVYRELRGRGIDAQRQLLPLVSDERPGVRTWAAAHALEFEPVAGESALEQIAEQPSLTGLTAEITLSEWRKGKLRFP